MHFHLPKPLHGWREFLGEIGIIVVGVLIALGAEQVVEASHWSHEVETERQSLIQEAQDSLDAVATRMDQQSCIDRRLNELKAIFQRHARGEALLITAPVGRPSWQSATRGSWQIALAGQALPHMDHDEKIKFSDAFGSFDTWDRASSAESEIWMRLSPLNDPELVAPEDWSYIRAAYAQAKIMNERMRLLAPFFIRSVGQELRLKQPDGAPPAGFASLYGQICQSILQHSS